MYIGDPMRNSAVTLSENKSSRRLTKSAAVAPQGETSEGNSMITFTAEIQDLVRVSLLLRYNGSKYHIKKLLESCVGRRQMFTELKKFKETAKKHNIKWNEKLP